MLHGNGEQAELEASKYRATVIWDGVDSERSVGANTHSFASDRAQSEQRVSDVIGGTPEYL
jgi:hypothetical protein